MRTLIFANGELNDGPAVRAALDQAGGDCLVIAANGGTRHAQTLGIQPQIIVGDIDSLDRIPDDIEIRRTSPEKDETDLELGLLLAVERGASWIRVIGAAGGRLDQAIGNVMLLALPELNGVDTRLVSGRQTTWLIADHAIVEGADGDTLSLLPLGGDASGVHTEGLKYPLKGETLYFGPARGMSNVFEGPRAEVWVKEGRLLAVHTPGRA